jgi:hypothetical protein
MAINEKGGNLYRPSRLTRDLAGSASASALLTGTASVTWRSAALAALLPALEHGQLPLDRSQGAELKVS